MKVPSDVLAARVGGSNFLQVDLAQTCKRRLRKYHQRCQACSWKTLEHVRPSSPILCIELEIHILSAKYVGSGVLVSALLQGINGGYWRKRFRSHCDLRATATT